MYSRIKAESSISMLDDNYDSFFNMSREDHDSMTLMMMELNEHLWEHTADNMRLVHSISGKQARSLLDEDEDEDEDVSLNETQAKPLPELAGNAQLPLVELGTVQPPNTARQSVGTVLGMESSALHNQIVDE